MDSRGATDILGLPLVRRGKVRDTYDLGDDRLLMVASDRISAFDVVLPQPIPRKGAVLTQLSRFWFDRTRGIVPNHFLTADVDDFPSPLHAARDRVAGRSMVVRRAERIPVECVVRGYLAGSGWADYRATGAVAGQALPLGLRLADRLPEPIFTPAAKNDAGHDEPLTLPELGRQVGPDLARQLQAISLDLYRAASDLALQRGIILADTKFEFGFVNGELTLIDEALTPDSSRFWEASAFAPGRDQPSFDKQPVRDWLERSGWNKQPPAPDLPDDVIQATTARYVAAFERLTGQSLNMGTT